MRLTVVDINGNLATIEMDDNSPVEDLKALVEVEVIYSPSSKLSSCTDEYSIRSTNPHL